MTPYTFSYRESHPNTPIGQPGRYQGFNAGVLLLHLDRIRASKEYEYIVSDQGVTEMAKKYGVRTCSISRT